MKNKILTVGIALIAAANLVQAKAAPLTCGLGDHAAPAQPVMTAQQAEAAVESFEAGASEMIRRIDALPEEYGGVIFAFSYASEPVTTLVNPTPSDFCFALREKNAFWTAAEAGLLDARRQAEAELSAAENGTTSGFDPRLDANFANLSKVMNDASALSANRRSLQAVRAILEDIVVDDKALSSPRRAQDKQTRLQGRKRALFLRWRKTSAPAPAPIR